MAVAGSHDGCDAVVVVAVGVTQSKVTRLSILLVPAVFSIADLTITSDGLWQEQQPTIVLLTSRGRCKHVDGSLQQGGSRVDLAGCRP